MVMVIFPKVVLRLKAIGRDPENALCVAGIFMIYLTLGTRRAEIPAERLARPWAILMRGSQAAVW